MTDASPKHLNSVFTISNVWSARAGTLDLYLTVAIGCWAGEARYWSKSD